MNTVLRNGNLKTGKIDKIMPIKIDPDMTSLDKPTIENIQEAVKESGYLMEQEIATILEGLGFKVQTASAFEDEDEGKSREIDIFATNGYYHNDELKLSIYCGILCECKNNLNPFVFIGRDKKHHDKFYVPKEIIFPVAEYYVPLEGKPNHNLAVAAFNYFKLEKIHHYFFEDQKAVQFCKIIRKGKKWEAQHDGVYDGLFLPLVKALEFQKSRIKKYYVNYNAIYAFYPIVVLNSELYYIDSNNPELPPREINHVSFIREIKSKNLDGTYLINFVNKRFLDDFVNEKIKPLINGIVDIANTNPKSLLKV